jgi:Holliday junction DNA helicase RuvA
MIASLRGTLAHKSPTEVIVDVGGTGYSVHIPLSTFEALGSTGSPVTLLTYLHVREDAMQLFGFFTEDEKEMFKLLISVSGIGPKMAQGILSGSSVGVLRENIIRGDAAALTAIPGIGKKLAERLLVELREKVGKLGAGVEGPPEETDPRRQLISEATLALVSLGYQRLTAEKAAKAALQRFDNGLPGLEELIKASLQSTGR